MDGQRAGQIAPAVGMVADSCRQDEEEVTKMGRFIIKLETFYLEWSEVVDAPTTFGMSLEEFKEYYRNRYGEVSMDQLEPRLERVENNGTSSLGGWGVGDFVAGNRAGPNETTLSIEEIIKAYCLQKPIRNGWLVPT